MINIQHKLDRIIYSYNPQEFLPIYAGSQLINKPAFVAYKAKRAGRRILSIAVRIVSVLIVGFITAATPVNQR